MQIIIFFDIELFTLAEYDIFVHKETEFGLGRRGCIRESGFSNRTCLIVSVKDVLYPAHWKPIMSNLWQ